MTSASRFGMLRVIDMVRVLASRRLLAPVVAGLLVAFVVAAAVAFACGPQARIAPNTPSGPAGAQVMVTGVSWEPGIVVKIHWGESEPAPLLASVTVSSSASFTTPITIPQDAAPGVHVLVALAVASNGHPVRSPATFTVTEPPPPPTSLTPPTPPAEPAPLPTLEPPPRLGAVADVFGPTLREAALASANGTRTASPAGRLSLFCGRYDEIGVTGTCGATAAPASRAAAARALSLRPRPFRARPGVPVYVRFRLNRAQRRGLAAARRMRMTGKIAARDELGNQTHATFALMLRAPRAPRRPRR